MEQKLIIEFLVKQGLNEHLILHSFKNKVYLGNLIYDKNRINFKDSGLLGNTDIEKLRPCWENGLLGMVVPTDKKKKWESLTFLGLEHCKLKVELSESRQRNLSGTSTQGDDTPYNFEGSIYRGFKLLLENQFLPVVLMQRARSKSGVDGLVITDLRVASLDKSKIQIINENVTNNIQKRLCTGVEESNLEPSDFEKYFGDYLFDK